MQTGTNLEEKGCRFPGAPAHSSVIFSDETLGPGSVASYTCERGFELLGPSRRVCENGQWLPEGIPFCGKHIFLFYVFLLKTTFYRRRKTKIKVKCGSCR